MRIATREARPAVVLACGEAVEDGAGAVQRVCLGGVGELAARGRTVVAAAGREFLVVRTRRGFVVVDDRCPHLGSRLDDAKIRRRSLQCSAHGFRYSLDDGAPLNRRPCAGGPGTLALLTTEVVGADLYVLVPAD